MYIDKSGRDEPDLGKDPNLSINMLDIPIEPTESGFSTNIYLLTDSNNPFGCKQLLQNHYYSALEELDVYNNRYLPRGEKRNTYYLSPVYAEISYFDNLSASCMAFKGEVNDILEDGKFVFQISDIDYEQSKKFTMNLFFDYHTELRRSKFFGINNNGRIEGPIHNSIRMDIEKRLNDIWNQSFNNEPFLIANIQELLIEAGIVTPIQFRYIGFKN
jgi:hypothetical protein